jgi:hypothetical protein
MAYRGEETLLKANETSNHRQTIFFSLVLFPSWFHFVYVISSFIWFLLIGKTAKAPIGGRSKFSLWG